MSNDVIPSSSVLSTINTNINVGMDEVVSVFVAKYEDSLFAKKTELSNSIRALKKELEGFDKKVRDLVDYSDYEGNLPNLGLSFEVGGVNVYWEKTWSNVNATTYEITINMRDSAKPDRLTTVKTYEKKIPASIVESRTAVVTSLEEKSAELLEVMSEIKLVGRKERQIRGRISEKKLNESGFAGLLTDPEMLKLVEIK